MTIFFFSLVHHRQGELTINSGSRRAPFFSIWAPSATSAFWSAKARRKVAAGREMGRRVARRAVLEIMSVVIGGGVGGVEIKKSRTVVVGSSLSQANDAVATTSFGIAKQAMTLA